VKPSTDQREKMMVVVSRDRKRKAKKKRRKRYNAGKAMRKAAY
jgi:hypothetical protein